MNIEDVESLRNAVISKHFPYFRGEPSEDYRLLQAIDAKTLWYIKLGITAKDLFPDNK